MSDTKAGEDGEASAGRSKTLSLKRTVESGQVRQSFSHGRSKSVLVEKRRKRTINSGGAEAAPVEEIAQEPEAPASPPDNLSKTQKDRRQAAVIEAKQRAIEEAKQSEIDARRRAEEEAQKAAEAASRAEALARLARGISTSFMRCSMGCTLTRRSD